MTAPEWLPGYYDQEAGSYDESRGGLERARAAAEAIVSLAPGPGRCLDVAGGTGVVSAELARRGWTVAVADLSAGMLQVAARRLPGRVVQALGDRLPIADASVDLVTVIWMLNLVPRATVDAVLADAARVLRPGGRLVVTVDKELAHDQAYDDISDGDDRITTVVGRLSLRRVGTATFSGASPWGSASAGDPVFRLAAFQRPSRLSPR